jgi:hypothetical protein
MKISFFNKITKLMVMALLALHYSNPLLAQNQPNVMDETLTDAYTVLGTTMGGAILGLSTLSFVEEPGDHLKNVVVGGAIGIILGVGIVAYGQASKSKDLYFQGAPGAPTGRRSQNSFDTLARFHWHHKSREHLKLKAEQNLQPSISKAWTF